MKTNTRNDLRWVVCLCTPANRLRYDNKGMGSKLRSRVVLLERNQLWHYDKRISRYQLAHYGATIDCRTFRVEHYAEGVGG